ncbi:MAG: deoxyhypusine synthase [Candidatus Woesearchaeota archaeon]
MSYKNTYMKKTTELDDHKKVQGPNLEKDLSLQEFLESFETIGFQATNLGRAINVVNEMIKSKSKIMLVFTGNSISSGLREIITYLVKQKKVHYIVTPGSGIEEDIIKTFSDFKIGDFNIPGRFLFEHGVGRIGNILVPNSRYLKYEKFLTPILKEFKGKTISSLDFTKRVAKELDENSYLYWADKNKIPVYSPTLFDGSTGDLMYFFKQKNEFVLDVLKDQKDLTNELLNQDDVSAIILGGGVSKHFALNANILREGLQRAVYLTTAQEFDGSDSGGNEEEAKSWAKINIDASHVKVLGDFTITFPLLVAASFKKNI